MFLHVSLVHAVEKRQRILASQYEALSILYLRRTHKSCLVSISPVFTSVHLHVIDSLQQIAAEKKYRLTHTFTKRSRHQPLEQWWCKGNRVLTLLFVLSDCICIEVYIESIMSVSRVGKSSTKCVIPVTPFRWRAMVKWDSNYFWEPEYYRNSCICNKKLFITN